MLFTGHSMDKNDLLCIVRAGLRVGLVGWRPHVAATSGALGGSNDPSWRTSTANICTHPESRVRRRIVVKRYCCRSVWRGQLEVAPLVTRLESNAGNRCIDLSRRIDASYAFTTG